LFSRPFPTLGSVCCRYFREFLQSRAKDQLFRNVEIQKGKVFESLGGKKEEGEGGWTKNRMMEEDLEEEMKEIEDTASETVREGAETRRVEPSV
jgi:hypothetical protein